jgi:hypothetical protein
MTPEQERDLLAAAANVLDGQALVAYQDLIELIRNGVAPRDAVAQVMQDFGDDMAATMAAALTAVQGEEVKPEDAQQILIGHVSLNSRLLDESSELAGIVNGMHDAQERAFSDLELFALSVYLSYKLRKPGESTPAITPRNAAIPERVRITLLRTPGVQNAIAAAFDRLAPEGLTPAQLQKAYDGMLRDFVAIKKGIAAEELEKRMKFAFFDRLLNFAKRIVWTKVHGLFARGIAESIMADPAVRWIQVMRSTIKAPPCMCDLFTGRDKYGQGKGVYPKEFAPLPTYHPNCLCWWRRRPDINARPTEPDADADAYFLRNIGRPIAARISGSRAKLARILRGEGAEAVINESRMPQYQIKLGRDV